MIYREIGVFYMDIVVFDRDIVAAIERFENKKFDKMYYVVSVLYTLKR